MIQQILIQYKGILVRILTQLPWSKQRKIHFVKQHLQLFKCYLLDSVSEISLYSFEFFIKM